MGKKKDCLYVFHWNLYSLHLLGGKERAMETQVANCSGSSVTRVIWVRPWVSSNTSSFSARISMQCIYSAGLSCWNILSVKGKKQVDINATSNYHDSIYNASGTTSLVIMASAPYWSGQVLAFLYFLSFTWLLYMFIEVLIRFLEHYYGLNLNIRPIV